MKNAHPTNADFIAHWRRVGPMLARIRKHELRTFNYKEKQAIIDDLLQIGVDFARPRTTSGLVDFQRILHKQKR